MRNTKPIIKSDKPTDRHTGVQYKVWVPAELRDAFNQACASEGLTPSEVQRAMMEDFVAAVAAKEAGNG